MNANNSIIKTTQPFDDNQAMDMMPDGNDRTPFKGGERQNARSSRGGRFIEWQDIPSYDDVKNLVSNLEYRRCEISDLPTQISTLPFAKKCNSCICAASGSSDSVLYTFVLLRLDNDYKIDEHPLLVHFDLTYPTGSFGGIIEHGKWEDRTVELNSEAIEKIKQKGITADFTYKKIPLNWSGSLSSLESNGMLEGITEQFRILLQNVSRKK